MLYDPAFRQSITHTRVGRGWGGMGDLNPRLPEPQSGALPTELIPPQGTFPWYQGGASGANACHNRTYMSEKEKFMKALVVCATLCSAMFAGSQESGLTASGRAAIEKAVLEVNAQMTRAAEERDIDRLFSFMLVNDRGSIIQGGNLFPTREEALATVKRNFARVAAIKYRWKRQLVTAISPSTVLLARDAGAEIRTAQEPPPTFFTPFAQAVPFRLNDGKWKALHAHNSAVPR